MFDKLKSENKIIFAGGDMNVNLLNLSSDSEVTQFLDIFVTCDLYPTIPKSSQ